MGFGFAVSFARVFPFESALLLPRMSVFSRGNTVRASRETTGSVKASKDLKAKFGLSLAVGDFERVSKGIA